MAFSDIDICNLALSKLGAARIDSFSDNTVESNECQAVYNMIVRYVQAKGPWQCNKLRTDLPQSTVPPDFGFAYAYTLPVFPECLRVLKINEDMVGDINYQVENNLLICDESNVSILYIGLITDPTKWGPNLEEAIVDQLVAQMAYKITGQLTAMQQLTEYAIKHREELLTLDSMQGSNDTLPCDTFINVRFSSGSSNGDDSSRPFGGG